MITEFTEDIKKGEIGETIFKEDFLEFLGLRYINIAHSFQVIDGDFLLGSNKKYEIKSNYKDDGQIIIEEYSNYNKGLGSVTPGWFYRSKADIIVFISKNTRTMIFLPFTEEFKQYYKNISSQYELHYNRISYHDGNLWQSAFKKIPLFVLKGFYSVYKKEYSNLLELENLLRR